MKAIVALVCVLAVVSAASVSELKRRRASAHLGVSADEACTAAGGACVLKSAGCNGNFVSGKCSGAPVCCVPFANTAACKAKNGACGLSASCKGSLIHGVCPGASVCCASSSPAPATPTPAVPVAPVAPVPVTPPPVAPPVTPAPSTGFQMTPAGPQIVPQGANQIGFCSADKKTIGMCKSSAACLKLAGFTAHSGVCAHGQTCCVPPAGAAQDGELGIDVEAAVISAKTAKCYVQTGFKFFMVRVWRTSGIVDQTCAPNIKALRAAGVDKVDVYMFADFRKDVLAGVDTFMAYLKAQDVLQYVNRVWLDIERDINGAYMWSRTDLKSNLAKVQACVERVKSHGKLPGIYAPGAGGWSEMMGTGKLQETNLPMWYVSKHGYNNDASDNDWVPFSNWSQSPPAAGTTQHQFSSGDDSQFKVCGVNGLDWTWRKAPITYPANWDPATNTPF